MIRRGSVFYRRMLRDGRFERTPQGRWRFKPKQVPPRDVPYEEALRFADIQMAIERAGQ